MKFGKLRVLFVLAVATVSIFALSASAWAVSDEATTTVGVTYHAGVGGEQQYFAPGTTRADIYSWITANVFPPSHKPSASRFTVNISGKVFTLSAAEISRIIPTSISFNYDLMADAAFTAQDGTVFTPGSFIKQSMSLSRQNELANKALRIAADRRRKATPARYAYSGARKRMVILAPLDGYQIFGGNVSQAMYTALAEWADGGYTGPITAQRSRVRIAAPTTALGRAIVVDKSERRLYLYNKGKKTSISYRCTIGKAGHSTPSGFYKIGVKRKNPTWGNPGSRWARNMPRFIGPGPRNPLGLRALNLNTSAGRDTMLRIHGTANTRQIGMAASHGCVRLTNSNVVKLFNIVPSGTPVIIQP